MVRLRKDVLEQAKAHLNVEARLRQMADAEHAQLVRLLKLAHGIDIIAETWHLDLASGKLTKQEPPAPPALPAPPEPICEPVIESADPPAASTE